MSEAMKKSIGIFKKYNLALEAKGGNQLIHFFKKFKAALLDIKEVLIILSSVVVMA
jgi:hypothetical protein